MGTASPAARIGPYPVQRHRLPASVSPTDPSVPTAPMPRLTSDMTMPGVQKPHCEPWRSTSSRWTGCVRPQALDGEQRPAVEHRREQDAGVDRAPTHAFAVQIAEQDGAGAAIAFRATLLGAGAAQVVAQERQDAVRGGGLYRDDFAVEEKADHCGAPSAIHRPSACRSARVMPVKLPSGMISESTATFLIRGAAARVCP